jgi:hypothetical protein
LAFWNLWSGFNGAAGKVQQYLLRRELTFWRPCQLVHELLHGVWIILTDIKKSLQHVNMGLQFCLRWHGQSFGSTGIYGCGSQPYPAQAFNFVHILLNGSRNHRFKLFPG